MANSINNTKEFFCYSKYLHEFMDTNKVVPIRKGVNYNTNNPYWVYRSGKIIDDMLDKYRYRMNYQTNRQIINI